MRVVAVFHFFTHTHTHVSYIHVCTYTCRKCVRPIGLALSKLNLMERNNIFYIFFFFVSACLQWWPVIKQKLASSTWEGFEISKKTEESTFLVSTFCSSPFMYLKFKIKIAGVCVYQPFVCSFWSENMKFVPSCGVLLARCYIHDIP